MDILLTIIASVLLLVGFLVICRTQDDDEEASPHEKEKGNPPT